VDDIAPSNRSRSSKRNDEANSGVTDVNFSEPFELFDQWFHDASQKESGDYTAMTLATANSEGVPSARMVLLKDASESGFVFYTNMESRKGQEMLENPVAALCFHWPTLQRSVRIEGPIEMVDESEADAYFASRPREARIGAWASSQSRVLQSRFELEKRVAKFTLKYNIRKVPRPPHWTGCRVVPKRIEFWSNKPFRLHDRTLYDQMENGWRKRKLYP